MHTDSNDVVPSVSVETKPDGTITVSMARGIHEACERFEAAWRRKKTPILIEELLDQTPPEVRQSLLRELVALELELRVEQGEQPDSQDYLNRFPRDHLIIETVFRTSAPESIEGYEILNELGRGGQCVVYKARQQSVGGRLVALKILRSGRMATEVEARRFRLGAEAEASLNHPNLAPIYEVGCCHGLHYFSMKLVENGSLSTHSATLRDQPDAIATLVAKVARAVHHAHDRGFIHRDLKPGNVLMDGPQGSLPYDCEPQVTDFGLAKRLRPPTGHPDQDPTRTGAVLGTIEYMAPEQAMGRRVDRRTDVYGLGAVLYALLTGRPPFRAASRADTLLQVKEKEPEPPRSINPKTPKDLEQIALKCLEKSPGRRYGTAEELADDLGRFLRGEPVHARRMSPQDWILRQIRREPAMVLRLLGIGAITLLTQVNYLAFRAETRNPVLHWQVTTSEAIWIVTVLIFGGISRLRGTQDHIRPLWIFIDIGALTWLLLLLGGANSTLVLGYPLLVAAAGLWSRAWLVWLAAITSAIAYSAIWLEHVLSIGLERNFYCDIPVVALLVTGWVVSHQIRRYRALSRYYGQRASQLDP